MSRTIGFFTLAILFLGRLMSTTANADAMAQVEPVLERPIWDLMMKTLPVVLIAAGLWATRERKSSRRG